jgi:thiol-disulfide isomerase/thioredoxin
MTGRVLSHLSPSDYFGDPAAVAAATGSSLAAPSTATTTTATTTTTTTTASAVSLLPPVVSYGSVQRLSNLVDFLHFIDSAPPNSLVVIKFFGNSCPLCRKIEMKYKKMARYYGPVAPIQFAEIEKRAYPPLFTALGIESFPYIQIYRNGQCVASHGTESDVTFEPIVKDTIERELLMSMDDWNAFLTAFAIPIQASTAKLNELRNNIPNT